MKTESRKEVLDRLSHVKDFYEDCSYCEQWSKLANAQEEIIEKMRESLEEISSSHADNQSPALNMPDLDYHKRVIRSMNRLAKEAIALADAPYGGRDEDRKR